jgi:hypothetical protein
MSSLSVYLKQAVACQRAAELSSDPILVSQLGEEHQMWMALARQSAAIDSLTAMVAGFDEREDPVRLVPA